MVQYRGQSWFSRNKFMFIPFIVVASILVILISILLMVGWSVVKTSESDVSGPERTVVLYGYDGEEIDRWEGFVQIKNNELCEISFIVDGKKMIIKGGIVVVEDR